MLAWVCGDVDGNRRQQVLLLTCWHGNHSIVSSPTVHLRHFQNDPHTRKYVCFISVHQEAFHCRPHICCCRLCLLQVVCLPFACFQDFLNQQHDAFPSRHKLSVFFGSWRNSVRNNNCQFRYSTFRTADVFKMSGEHKLHLYTVELHD